MRTTTADALKLAKNPALLVDGTGDILRLMNAEEAKKHPGVHVEVSGVRENDIINVPSMVAK